MQTMQKLRSLLTPKLLLPPLLLVLYDWLVEKLSEKTPIQGIQEKIPFIKDIPDNYLIVFVIFLILVLSVWTNVREELQESSEAKEQPARHQLPSRVRRELLAGVKSEVKWRLNNSLHNALFINLLKEEQPQQVRQPWTEEVKVSKEASVQLPIKTDIIEVFDREEVAGKLLILGAPGAGKTTTLLKLANDLIRRAESSAKEPIPVLFNLASWNNQPIAKWLVAELKLKYGVSENISQQLLENRQLLPLLDGLDELALECQEPCIQAINQFQLDYHPKSLVACCRLAEYENANTPLQLNGAIYLQPLTEAQIHKYLMGVDQSALWQSIQAERELMALAKSPLLLSITILAYKEISIQEWQALSSAQARCHYLFKTYTQCMLERKVRSYAKGKEPIPQQTQHWLSWLAKILQKQAQPEFLIEKIQPGWLQSPAEKRIYHLSVDLLCGLIGGFVSGFAVLQPLAGLVGGLIAGLMVWLIGELSEGLREEMKEGLPEGLSVRLVNGLISGLIYGLVVGLIGGLVGGLTVFLANRFTGELMSSLISGLKVGCTGGLIGGLVGGLIGGLRQKIKPVEVLKRTGTKASHGLVVGLRNVLIVGLIFGSIFGSWQGLNEGLREGWIGGLIVGLIINSRDTVKPVETLQWSKTKAWRGLRVGMLNGLVIGLIGGLIGQLNEGLREGLIFGLVFGLTFGLIGALIGGLVSGFSGPDIVSRRVPNQGIWQSAINAVVFSLIGGFSSGLIGGLIGGLTIGLEEGLRSALIFGLKSALIFGLLGGLIGGLIPGTACIQHFTLRVLLCWNGSTPWNYARFLNYATERRFLQNIGGRYQFIHPLLQDHFVEMRSP